MLRSATEGDSLEKLRTLVSAYEIYYMRGKPAQQALLFAGRFIVRPRFPRAGRQEPNRANSIA